MATQDSAPRTKVASPATVGEADYYYAGRVKHSVKASLEEGAKVPVWVTEDKGADYWGQINGQAFVIRSTEGQDRPRMVPPALASNYITGRQAERELRREIERRTRLGDRPLSEMPEFVR